MESNPGALSFGGQVRPRAAAALAEEQGTKQPRSALLFSNLNKKTNY